MCLRMQPGRVFEERRIMEKLNGFPFIVSLYAAFQVLACSSFTRPDVESLNGRSPAAR